MIRLLQRIPLFLAIVTGMPGADVIPEPQDPPPNILMIFVDDLNDYVGCLGHPNAITPNMDQLASEGVLFTNAHCQAPLCGPSRASIMTGLRPSTTGIYGQIDDEDLREASEVTRYVKYLPEYLKEHGYHTMGVGKIFHKHAPEGVLDESGGRNGGFGPKPPGGKHFKWEGEGTSTDWGSYPEEDASMPDYQSAQWAVERLDREYDQPFFLTVGFFRPHVPWYVPQQWFDKYGTEKIITPPYRANDFDDIPAIVDRIDALPMMPTTEWAIHNDEWQNIIEAYLASVTFVDHYVGIVLDALRESPHAENTIVVLLSDHGYRLGEKGTFAKNCLWEECTRVPLMIRGPGIEQRLEFSDPVELLDLYPTLLDLAGLPHNPMNEGKSLRSVLEGRSLPEDSVAISTYGRNNHAVISRNFHYIKYEDTSEELYDNWRDPHGFDNVAQNPAYTDARRRLKSRLPVRNRFWAPASKNNWPDYFISQREAQSAAFDFSVEEALQYCTVKAQQTAQAVSTPGHTPVVIASGHRFWEMKSMDRWGWTHGFWPGILWYAYEATGNNAMKQQAVAFTRELEGILDRKIKSHDVGFIYNCSFGNAFRITGKHEYRDTLIRAADKLVELYNPRVGTLLSWPSKVENGTYAPHNTIIDSMMNLELLFRASELSGDSTYSNIARSHADRIMSDLIRPDFSTYHLAVFDDRTGELLQRHTHQGYADDSLWARGQAWAIYGFTMSYRETGEVRYLKIARNLADTFLSRLPQDHIPYWDFDDPAIPEAPRDASAAAIAASALVELSSFVKNTDDGGRYLKSAESILESLSTDDYRSFEENAAFLSHSTGSKPREREVDVPLIYADYYYLEALLRLKNRKGDSKQK